MANYRDMTEQMARTLVSQDSISFEQAKEWVEYCSENSAYGKSIQFAYKREGVEGCMYFDSTPQSTQASAAYTSWPLVAWGYFDVRFYSGMAVSGLLMPTSYSYQSLGKVHEVFGPISAMTRPQFPHNPNLMMREYLFRNGVKVFFEHLYGCSYASYRGIDVVTKMYTDPREVIDSGNHCIVAWDPIPAQRMQYVPNVFDAKWMPYMTVWGMKAFSDEYEMDRPCEDHQRMDVLARQVPGEVFERLVKEMPDGGDAYNAWREYQRDFALQRIHGVLTRLSLRGIEGPGRARL